MASTTNELLRAVLNSKRTPSSGGRTASKPSSRKGTPKLSRSVRGSRAVSRDVSDDELDDAASIASEDTWYDAFNPEDEESEEAIGDNWESDLQEALDALGEKRATAREKALGSVVRIMSQAYVGEGLEGSRISCLEALRRCARSPKTDMEAQLALCGISLWFINFGMESEPEDYTAISEQLKALVIDRSKAASARSSALATLGMANFVAGSDFRDAAALLQFVDSQVLKVELSSKEHGAAAVVRQALETYGLLMTVIADGNARLAEQLFDTSFDVHMRALAADNVELRVAAAQNFALIHSTLARENGTTNANSNGSSPPLLSFEFERQDELVATLQVLQHESAKKHGKRGTSTQRSAMREILRTIEHGEMPKLKISIREKTLRLNDWSHISRLHAFRTLLGSGLPTHFVDNPLLQEVFQVEFDGSGYRYLVKEARTVVDPNSELAKARTLDMQRRRRNAREAKAVDNDADDDYY
ncbi:Interferon- developmental regulator 1 [Coemansia spiralis]|uniref:Interferon- developmental regulator 1 n=2 Tax=Coemansia TaxID=4863 RepID=A0A9W8GCS1_9FUNG|nr:interferon-related developmental regulator-domain-containing protein [Coemansia spiralis]KAJ1995502.1 Interferon- developmental regulator 1 [Coemansia umbellata]KAJ2625165.1 Interferon- developmental regulator 1 [Coemansia sp. RSA 1358]KAJ2679881.1 Interferon- developmental regulator 1 [Coemansia spiralis]